MAIFISYPISTLNPRDDKGVSGWYGVWYENCHIIVSIYQKLWTIVCKSHMSWKCQITYLWTYAVSEDSDRTAHLNGTFWTAKDAKFLQLDHEVWSDCVNEQADFSLHWVTCSKICFLSSRYISWGSSKHSHSGQFLVCTKKTCGKIYIHPY